jgi:cytochrome c553
MRIRFFLLFLAAGAAQATPFAGGSAENGKKLFTSYECSSCHKAKMGGDGSAIFSRPNHTVRAVSDLIPQIKFCSGAVGAQLTAQEEQDLAAYLNQRYYQLK